ncbi:hypothetical protein CVIRNUC_008682 [Coccomyxa viridis]|uniref:Histone deacetylase domain-containing protein n=1 Tax=Coccomyxa viridis TaxID=1274662 RepID=A0AAV1IHQ2_9CHLO|nr:hypothetical protein CVIRNUC_008682 [Coccomyxa viridis]
MASAQVAFAVAASSGHDLAGHYECAKRIPAIMEALEQARLTPDAQPQKIMEILGARTASKAELEAVHSPAHIADMRQKALQDAPCVVADFEETPDNTTYMAKSSFDDALQAVGSALAVVDAVMGGVQAASHTKGFAVIRPPGHHATKEAPMGFCLFNNVAIAARYAQQRYGLRKVMIVDFDVHHGNGTQDLFYNDDSVLFIDIHQHQVWPGSGHVNESGQGAGDGYTINVPLPVGSGHEAALRTFQRVVQPAAARFQPDIILASAGYDAHMLDPLEKLNYQSATYHALVSSLMSLSDRLCSGRLAILLEGGYSFQGLSEGVCNSFQALIGGKPLHDIDAHGPAEPSGAVDEVLGEVVATHKLQQ